MASNVRTASNRRDHRVDLRVTALNNASRNLQRCSPASPDRFASRPMSGAVLAQSTVGFKRVAKLYNGPATFVDLTNGQVRNNLACDRWSLSDRSINGPANRTVGLLTHPNSHGGKSLLGLPSMETLRSCCPWQEDYESSSDGELFAGFSWFSSHFSDCCGMTQCMRLTLLSSLAVRFHLCRSMLRLERKRISREPV